MHASGMTKRAYHGGMKAVRWPDLPRAWADSYATLHMWAQIVGKVALAQAPAMNHCWSVAFQVTARNSQRFDCLVDGTGADCLDFSKVVLTNHPGNSTGNSGGT